MPRSRTATQSGEIAAAVFPGRFIFPVNEILFLLTVALPVISNPN
jgi:hypothetical protein